MLENIMETLWISTLAAILAVHPISIGQSLVEIPSEPEPAPVVEVVVEIPKIPAILEKIAECESRDRHFAKDGTVLRGEINKQDIGKYQINVKYWGKLAEKLGHDIFTEEGNEAMALAIYGKHGTKPWKYSKYCWGRTATNA